MSWRRILTVIGICELVFAAKLCGDVFELASDPLPAIIGTIGRLLPAFDLAQLMN